MAIETPPSLTTPPTPPDDSVQTGDAFDAACDAWNTWQASIGTEYEALALNMYNNALETLANAQVATNSATTATNAATSATNSATTATNAATSATNSATTATNAATSATNSATTATNAATSATGSQNLAEEWAENDEDVPVTGTSGDGFSAKHWAQKAALAAGVIDDNSTSTLTSWSSDKIETEIGNAVVDTSEFQLKTKSFVASATISSNRPAMLLSDGTVANGVVGTYSVVSAPASFSSNTGNTSFYAEKINSNYTVVVVSKSVYVYDISSGSAVYKNQTTYDATGGVASNVSVSRLSDSLFVITYSDSANSLYGTAIAITIDSSGALTLGTKAVFYSGTCGSTAVKGLSETRFAILYENQTNAVYLVLGSVSGTTLGVVTTSVVTSLNAPFTGLRIEALDSENLALCGALSGNIVRLVPVVVGASSFAIGSSFNVTGLGGLNADILAMSSSELLLAYRDASTAYGRLIVVGYDGSIFSQKSITIYNSSSTLYPALEKMSETKAALSFVDQANSNYGSVITVSLNNGVALTSSENIYNTFSTGSSRIVSIDGENVSVFFVRDSTSTGTYVATYDLTDIVSKSFVGITNSSVTSGNSVEVSMAGSVKSNMSGLSVGSNYYLDEFSGLLTTEDTGRKVGLALSATEMLILDGGE